jgi:hypothetical protein
VADYGDGKMIIYTNCLVPDNSAAITFGFIILIRPKYRGDIGLLAHERTHVRQWRESWGAFWPRYLLSKRRRRDYEVEAYREQLRHSPDCLDLFASYLTSDYKLGISLDLAKSLLSEAKAKSFTK